MTQRIKFFLFVILIILASSTNTSIYCVDFHETMHELYPYQWDELLLGRIHSEVWGSTKHDIVLKARKIDKENLLTNDIKEFSTQLQLYHLLQEYDQDGSLCQRATILEPKNLKISEECSRYFFTLERLYPIHKGKFAALRRVYLGCRNNNHDIKKPRAFAAHTPNNYYSYQEVENIVNAAPRINEEKSNIEQFCYDLGTLLALIQLGARKAGHNIEVSLVKRSKDSDFYKMVILDFDKVRDLDSLFVRKDEDAIVYALHSTMKSQNYYPFPTELGFRHFRDGYFTFAANLDKKEKSNFYIPLAEKLFRKYIAFWLRNKSIEFYCIENASNSYTSKLSYFKKLLKKDSCINSILSLIEQKDYYIQVEKIFEEYKG